MTVNKRLNAEELEVIRKRAEEATPGPWKCGGDKFGDIVVYSPECRGFHNNGGEVAGLNYGSDPDAGFIAHAREDVPKLLAEIERLRRALEEISDINEYVSGDVAREVLKNAEA
jgi:hypothetical protein